MGENPELGREQIAGLKSNEGHVETSWFIEFNSTAAVWHSPGGAWGNPPQPASGSCLLGIPQMPRHCLAQSWPSSARPKMQRGSVLSSLVSQNLPLLPVITAPVQQDSTRKTRYPVIIPISAHFDR